VLKSIGQFSASRNINESSKFPLLSTEGGSFADLISGNIGVGAISEDVVEFDVGKGRVHPSSIASLVSLRAGAVNEFLFRKADGSFMIFKFVGGFEGSGG